MPKTIPCWDCKGPGCKTCNYGGVLSVYTKAEHFQEMLKFKLTYQDDYIMKVGTVNPSQVVGKVYSEDDHNGAVKKAVKAERETVKELLEECKELFDHVISGDPQCSLRIKLVEAIRARNK